METGQLSASLPERSFLASAPVRFLIVGRNSTPRSCRGRSGALNFDSYMMNPIDDQFGQADPATSLPPEINPTAENDGRLRRVAQRAGSAAADTWQTTKERTGIARERTEMFVRENPVPTVVGALLVGVLLGRALRHATMDDEEEIIARPKLGNLGLGSLSLPLLWPFLKSVKEKSMKILSRQSEGRRRPPSAISTLPKYTKPIRKRWKAWMD